MARAQARPLLGRGYREKTGAASPQRHVHKFMDAAPVAAPTAAPPVELDLRSLTLRQLRSAIQRNAVSFPSQMPNLTPRNNENQWRMAHLFFIAGWPLQELGKRYNLGYWWVGRLIREWVERAIALGYVQQIPPEEPFPARGDQKPEFQLRRQVPGRPIDFTDGASAPDQRLQETPDTQRRTRRSESEAMAVLEKLRLGLSVEEICETAGITRRTFFAWKGKFGNLSESELAELHTLREENQILRRWSAWAALLLARSVESSD